MPFSLIPFILISGILFLVTTPIQQQNTQPNQSFSSSQSQNQKLASTTSSSSSQKSSSNSSQKTNCTPTKPPISSEKLQTYTNPSYPNLKINYDNSWKMECTSQKARFYENILVYKVILKKNNSELNFNFAPIIPTGCSGGEESPGLADLGQFKRYKTGENPYNKEDESNSYYYSKSSFCNLANKIKSNITRFNFEKKLKNKF
jgi:hypothetical protein